MGLLALQTDTPWPLTESISSNVSIWLWTVFSIVVVTLASWLVEMKTHPLRERVFYYVFFVPLASQGVTYYAMASNLGNVPTIPSLNVERSDDYFRAEFLIHYIPTFFVSIGVNMNLMLVSGVSWATIVFTIVVTLGMYICLLISAIVSTNYKWGWFAFHACGVVVLSFLIGQTGLRESRRVGVHQDYRLLAIFALVVDYAYTICWGLGTGSNTISVNAATIFHSVIDLLQLPVWGSIFLAMSRRWDYDVMGLHFTVDGRSNTGYAKTPNVHVPVNHGHNPTEEHSTREKVYENGGQPQPTRQEIETI
ncbi:MAG: hypothetical protein M1818_008319 [Claussenomyces sp. TS43310]|nr:MAG: hypothetical protein M1818_008319 [Claussenomyces sp. TS43310]